MIALLCPKCGTAPSVNHTEWHWGGFVVSCGNCYDGAPDAGRQLIESAPTEAEAIERWNEAVTEYRWDIAPCSDHFVETDRNCFHCGGE